MKKLITILIVFISLNTYAQEVEPIQGETVTERVIDKYSDKIITGFNETIDKITPLAQEGFAIVVKLKFVNGIIHLIPVILLVIISIVALIKWNKMEWGDDSPGGKFFIAVVLLILSILTAFTLHEAITHIFVPEWYAIKEIMNLI